MERKEERKEAKTESRALYIDSFDISAVREQHVEHVEPSMLNMLNMNNMSNLKPEDP